MKRPWSTVETSALVPVLCVLGLAFLVIYRSHGFVMVLDHANLAFHEAGHLFFGILGQTMGLYGGTLGQLVFPAVTGIVFWWRGETISFVFSGIWFFENFPNIARYMADARAQQLPLVGGGDHDWTRIFGNWGVLHQDTRIAGLFHVLGWLGMFAMVGWLLWRWHNHRQETMESIPHTYQPTPRNRSATSQYTDPTAHLTRPSQKTDD